MTSGGFASSGSPLWRAGGRTTTGSRSRRRPAGSKFTSIELCRSSTRFSTRCLSAIAVLDITTSDVHCHLWRSNRQAVSSYRDSVSWYSSGNLYIQRYHGMIMMQIYYTLCYRPVTMWSWDWKLYWDENFISVISKILIQPRTAFVNQAGKSTKSVEKFEWWAKMELKKCEMSLGDSGTLWSMSFHLVGRKKWPCYVGWQKAKACSKSIDNFFLVLNMLKNCYIRCWSMKKWKTAVSDWTLSYKGK